MADFVSRFVSASDGLRLHYRDYGAEIKDAPVAVCLPGLARTAIDFEPLVEALAAPGELRRVLVLDYRGRGESGWDSNPDNYDLMVESDDILAVLAQAGVSEASFIGTSRGGLHTMVLATLRPAVLRGAVLNDIGPVIEPRGLARIRGYVGKLPQPKSWIDAIDLLRQLASSHFTALTPQDWETFAHATFHEKDGALVPRYDPALMRALEKLDLDNVPTLWPQFEALRFVPILAIRGENSDLLSPETLAEMGRRHPHCSTFTVPGQGHAPLLSDAPTIDRILGFVRDCESQARGAARAQGGLRLLA